MSLYLALYEDERIKELKIRKLFKAVSDEKAIEKAESLRASFWDVREIYRLDTLIFYRSPRLPKLWKKRLD